MEAPSSFKEAIAIISYRIRRICTPTPLPFPLLSHSYKSSGCIAHHEGILHPVGTLFILHREHEILLSAGVGGEISQEKTFNNGTHTVLASYGGNACERTLSLSTSHILGPRSCIKLYYENSSRGDSCCSLHAHRNLNEELLLSSSYAEGLSSDPTFDVELEQERSFYKITGKLVKNLRNGLHHLHIQSTVALLAELTLKNFVSTDLQGNGYSRFEVAWPSSNSSYVSRVLLGMDGRRELALQGSQSFRNATHVEVLASTKDDAQNIFSLKLEHKFSKENKLSMNVSRSSSGIQEASIMASIAQQNRSWKLKYRKFDDDGHSLGLEWQFRGDSDGVCSLSIEAGHHGQQFRGNSDGVCSLSIAVNGELCHVF